MATFAGCSVAQVDSIRNAPAESEEEPRPSGDEPGPGSGDEQGSGDEPGPTASDPPQSGTSPALAVADARGSEEQREIRFQVTLAPPSEALVTVAYATENGTAMAGLDYTEARGALTFTPGTKVQTIAVAILPDDGVEEPENFTITLSDPRGAIIRAARAVGTIVDSDDPSPGATPPPSAGPTLAALEVRRTSVDVLSISPPFAPAIEHYAAGCPSNPVTVTAQALDSRTELTLLRRKPSDNQSATGTLVARVGVGAHSDLAIELRNGDGTRTYVLHCIPSLFPTIKIAETSAEVSDGLLLITPTYGTVPFVTSWLAVVDNNGVPRYRQQMAGSTTVFRNFRSHSGNRYSAASGNGFEYTINLFDRRLEGTGTTQTIAPATPTDGHDFLITPEGNYLFISYAQATRDFSIYGSDYSIEQDTRDSVIQELTPQGQEVFRWNTWDHMDVMNTGNDCKASLFPLEYSHLNSLQIVGGDIIASLRECAQVLRIDRSSGTGAVQWKLGGTSLPAESSTKHLPISGDPAGEFCGLHQATLTSSGTVVLFDNGTDCKGPRKDLAPFSRVVEYDISSGTAAAFQREYRLPERYGYSKYQGGVTVLSNGHWLITWGVTEGREVSLEEAVAVTEVDPQPQPATVLFQMHMSKSTDEAVTYRVYRVSETDIDIPLRLP